MDLLGLLFLNLLTWTNMGNGNKYASKFQGNFWQTLTPGELLNELDFMTTDELQNARKSFATLTNIGIASSTTAVPLKKLKPAKTKPKKNQKKIKSSPVGRITNRKDDDNAQAASASASTEHDNYDNTYEQFVKSYFNDAADHYLADNDDYDNYADASASKEARDLSGSIETYIDAQPFETSPKATKKANKNCRKVHKNGEICLICKNSRTDEHSETCSYEHSSEPEAYAYETQRKFSKKRDSEDDEKDDADENVGAEDDSSEYVAETKLLTQTLSPLAAVTATNSDELSSNSSCIKRSAGGKGCYYCRNSLGELKINCFAIKPSQSLDDTKDKPLNENSHKQRRIFKRTLSYVFEKGHDSNGTLLPNEFTQNSTEYLN